MTEITKTDASKLDLDEMRQLIRFADCQEWCLTSDVTVQGVLDLYHVSGEYIDIASWLESDAKAPARFKRLQKKHKVAA